MMAKLLPSDRAVLLHPALDLPTLRSCVQDIASAIVQDEDTPDEGEAGERRRAYQALATPAYGLSKLAVNCYTQIMARDYPAIQCNAASPGFTNTGEGVADSHHRPSPVHKTRTCSCVRSWPLLTIARSSCHRYVCQLYGIASPKGPGPRCVGVCACTVRGEGPAEGADG